MKTTSYEISKKLKEIGFSKKSHQFYWVKYKNDIMPQEPKLEHWEKIAYTLEREEFPSYDLETLLDALPDFITKEYKSKVNWEVKAFRERLIIEKKEIRYSCDDIENADDANRFYQEYGYMQDITVFKKFNDKSLADTAGKMWLMLKEKGLV